MIFWLSSPFQDHAAALIVVDISKIVWKTVTDICHIAFGLPEMEVTRKNTIESAKMFCVDFAVIGHLYHGVHLEMRQLKMPKHVFC